MNEEFFANLWVILLYFSLESRLIPAVIQSHYLNRCIESRLVPLDTLGTGLSVNIFYCTRTSGVSFGTISIEIDIQHFQWIKSISNWRLLNGRHIFLASIWLFENIPWSLDTLGTKPTLNIVYRTMFLYKISENIYILPIWASTVINQIVNKLINALKQPHHMNPIFIVDEKASHSKQPRQDKAWQGKARRGQTRQDEAAPRQEGVPWFWKIM